MDMVFVCLWCALITAWVFAAGMRVLEGPMSGLVLVICLILLTPQLVAEKQTVTQASRWEAEILSLTSVRGGVAEFEIKRGDEVQTLHLNRNTTLRPVESGRLKVVVSETHRRGPDWIPEWFPGTKFRLISRDAEITGPPPELAKLTAFW